MSNAMRSGKRLLAGVAAVALGAGVLTFVGTTSAQAAPVAPTSITGVSQFGPMRSGGVATSLNATFFAAAATTNDTVAPTSINVVINGVSLRAGGLDRGGFTLVQPTVGPSYDADDEATLPTTGANSLRLSANAGTPPGTYTAFIYFSAGADFVTGDVKSANFTVTVAGAPLTMSVTPTTSVTIDDSANNVAVSLLDSAGRQTSLTTGEEIDISASGGSGTLTTAQPTSVTGGTNANVKLTATDYAAGLVTFNGRVVGLVNDAAALRNIIFTPNAVLDTQLSTVTFTVQAQWVAASTGFVANDAAVVTVPTDAFKAGTNTWQIPVATTTITVRVPVTTTGGGVTPATSVALPYQATSNAVVGSGYFSQSGQAVTDALGNATVTLTVPTAVAVNGNAITIDWYASAPTRTTTIVFDSGTPVYSFVAPGTSIVTTAVAGTTNLVVAVTDQFELPISGAVVTFTVQQGSRNGSASASTTLATVTTGADGLASTSLKDASTSTSNLVDTITTAVTYDGDAVGVAQVAGAFGTLTINYGQATLNTLTATVVGTTQIQTSTDVASVGGATAAARGAFTVFASPSGIPVTVKAPTGVKISTTAAFNLASTDAKDSIVIYPNSGGSTIYVAATKSGVAAITVEGGGKTASVSYTFTSPVGAARILTVTPDKQTIGSGQTASVVAKVVDGWGNPVPNVQVNAQASGLVYFTGGVAATNLNTGLDGTVRFIAISPPNQSGESLISFTLANVAQSQDAAGFPITGFPAGVQTATSAVTTGAAPVTKTIVIAGSRGTVSGKPGIIVDGSTTGFDVGSKMVPSIRFPGQTEYTVGSARPTTSAAGDFTWQRKTGKKIYVFFTNEAGDVRSNRIIIAAN